MMDKTVYLDQNFKTEDHILGAILDGFTVIKGDAEISDLGFRMNNWGDKPRVQVYKRRHKEIDKKGHPQWKEYSKLFSNYREAVENFLGLVQ